MIDPEYQGDFPLQFPEGLSFEVGQINDLDLDGDVAEIRATFAQEPSFETMNTFAELVYQHTDLADPDAAEVNAADVIFSDLLEDEDPQGKAVILGLEFGPAGEFEHLQGLVSAVLPLLVQLDPPPIKVVIAMAFDVDDDELDADQ